MSGIVNNDKLEFERERDAANLSYFVSLSNSRASLTKLPLMAFLTAFLLGLVTMTVVGSTIFYAEHNPTLLPLFCAHLVVIGFSVLMLLLSAFKGWVFRFQVFSSGLMVVFAVIGWVYTLCFMALGIASVVEDTSFIGGQMVSIERLTLMSIIGALYVCGATSVHVLLLRKRLREGHSAKRTMGNYLAASSVYRSKSLWIIFAVAVISPNVLTGGEYVILTLGVLMFLFFASAVTSLPVEFGYLAYLKSRDRRYWEKRPPKIVVKRAQKIAAWKKFGKVALIIFGFFVALVVLTVIAK